MYLYGVYAGTRFALLAGGSQLKQAIQLVRDAGHGEIKRLKNDPSNSGGYAGEYAG